MKKIIALVAALLITSSTTYLPNKYNISTNKNNCGYIYHMNSHTHDNNDITVTDNSNILNFPIDDDDEGITVTDNSNKI